MTRVPIGASVSNRLRLTDQPARSPARGTEFNQGVAAEMMANKWGLSCEALDEFAARSHENLAAGIDSGPLAGQPAPVTLSDGRRFAVDEGLRRGTSAQTLAQLRPAFVADGLIHAGNSSQISDGSAALLMTTSDHARALGLRPLVRVRTAAVPPTTR